MSSSRNAPLASRTYPARSWIHPGLVAGPSAIHRDGVFTREPIAAGTKLMEFGGEPISRAQADGDDFRARSVWAIATDRYLALPVDDPDPSLDENLNHACDANAWLDDEVTLVARRDIAAGEEITLDQGTWNFDEAEYTWDRDRCHCGAADCRVTLTENDWKLPAVQERYAGHFHPMVQEMIDRESRR